MALTSESSLLSLMVVPSIQMFVTLSLSPEGCFTVLRLLSRHSASILFSLDCWIFVGSLGCCKHLLFDDSGQVSFPSRLQGRIQTDISLSLPDFTWYAFPDRRCLTKSHPVSRIYPSRCRNISNMIKTPTAEDLKWILKKKEKKNNLSVFKISLMDQLVLCMIWKH